VVALWPWLWSDPLGHLGQALIAMSRFRFDNEILYMGELVRTMELPWHYLPVWISITMPPLYLLLFAVGTAATSWRLIVRGRELWRGEAELQDLVFLCMFAAPIAAAILLHSVLYNGWRQFYFVGPVFLLVALRGWHCLWQAAIGGSVRRPALIVVTAVSLVATAAWMWRVHPLQNVYFNFLAGSHLAVRFELDYWGLSARGALEHVLANDRNASIDVLDASDMALEKNLLLLAPHDRQRLRVTTNRDTPHYVFTNGYRSDRDAEWRKHRQDYEPFYQVKVDDEAILSVFRRKFPDPGIPPRGGP